MKQILIILIIFSMWGKCYAQTTKVAGSTSANAPVVYTVKGADDSKKKSIDSLALVLRAEYKKLLSDSMAVLQPVKPITDAIDATNKTVANLTTIVSNNSTNINGITNRVITLEANGTNYNTRITALETWKGTTTTQLATINEKIAALRVKGTINIDLPVQ